MAVLRPLRVIIENWSENQTETYNIANHPQKSEMGSREVGFAREIFIEQDDFAENPPKDFKRLVAGGEVRLRGSYVIKCEQVIKDNAGQILELRCSYDPATLGKNPEGRKVKGVIHWVAEQFSFKAEVRLYDRLFSHPQPDTLDNFLHGLNPNSLEVLTDCRMEASLKSAKPQVSYQFERTGYFCMDGVDSSEDKMVFNRTVTLRDSWGK